MSESVDQVSYRGQRAVTREVSPGPKVLEQHKEDDILRTEKNSRG